MIINYFKNTKKLIYSWFSLLVFLSPFQESYVAWSSDSNLGIANKYVVIIATSTKKNEGLALLSKWKKYDLVLVCTDSFSGLEPGYYVVVESVHLTSKAAIATCKELKSRDVDCYVRYAGERISEEIPTLEEAKRIVKGGYPRDATIEYAIMIDARKRSFPMIAVSHPVEKRVHPYTPYKKDYVTRVLIFLGSEPTKIEDHNFLKPTFPRDDIWEDIGCNRMKQLPLSIIRPVPTTIAQNCWYEGASLYHYMIFDNTNLHDPTTGTATWTYSEYPHATHHAFVPNDDPQIPPGISPKKGDGRTVLEGTEGKEIHGNEDSFLVRDFTAVWEKRRLIFHYGPWEKVEQEDVMIDGSEEPNE